MSAVDPAALARRSTVDTIATFMSAAALFFALVALAYHPIPIACAAILISLVAAGMSSRYKLLALGAVSVSTICFVAGVAIAVVTNNSLW